MKKEAAPAMDFKLASSLTGPFTAIARAMSGQWGINVIPNGFRCATDTKKNIWIPFAADHLGEEGRRALHGMLDHEVCHVVEEMEHEKAGRAGYQAVAKTAKNRTVALLLNVVEDIRIERKWEVRYPGVAQNLMDCHRRVLGLNRRDWPKAKRSFWDSFGLALFAKARGVDGDIGFVGEKALKALADCDEEMKALDTLEWIQDSYDLAERIWNKINRDAEETLERAKKTKKEKKPAKKPEEKPEEKKEEEETSEKPEPGEEGEPSDEGKPSDETDEDGEEPTAGDDEDGGKPGSDDEEAGDDETDLDGEEDDDDEDLDDSDDEGSDDDSGAAGDSDESEDDGDDSDDEDGEDGAGSGAGDEGEEADDDEESDEDAEGGAGGSETDEDLDEDEDDSEEAGGAGGGGSGDDEPSDEDIETAKEILAGAEGDGEGSAGEAEGAVAVGPSDEEDAEPPTAEDIEAAKEILGSIAGIEDFVRLLADELEKEAREDAREHKLYIPDPAMRKLDKWFKPEGGTLENYKAAKADVDAQIGAIRGKQLAFIQTITRKRLITGQDSGMLDQAALSTVRTGSLDVFADIKKGIALDTAIEVLLDLSGSMGPGDVVGRGELGLGEFLGRTGGKWPAYYCKRIAIALVEAWEPLRLPNEFIGFTNNHGRAIGGGDPDCVRRAPFDFHVFKAWGERLSHCRERFSTIEGHEDNADGEAVLAAAQRLALRPEKRKMLVVISDGYPAHMGIGGNVLNEHLKETVRKITRAGTEVLGVGAGTDAPERFYNSSTGAKNLIIKDLNTLAPRLFKTLRESILK